MAWDKYLAEQRSQKAIDMRAMGVDYDFIAKELGYADRSGAWRAVNRGMKRLTTEHAAAYRSMGLMQLDIMLEKIWPSAASGNPYAVTRALQIMDRQARLSGLYDKCECVKG